MIQKANLLPPSPNPEFSVYQLDCLPFGKSLRSLVSTKRLCVLLMPLVLSFGCSDDSTTNTTKSEATTSQEPLSFRDTIIRNNSARIISVSEDPIYQFQLAAMLKTGAGVKSDVIKAIEWFKKASDNGHIIATATLGEIYSTNEAGSADKKLSFSYYLTAAERGYPSAQYNVGVFYSSGEGCNKDLVESAFWFHLAALRGHQLATKFLPRAWSQLTPEQITSIQSRASSWSPQSLIPETYVARIDDINSKLKRANVVLAKTPPSSDDYTKIKGEVLFYTHEIRAWQTEIYLYFGFEADDRRTWRVNSNRWLEQLSQVATREQAISTIKLVNNEIKVCGENWGSFPLDASRYSEAGLGFPLGSAPFSAVTQKIFSLTKDYKIEDDQVSVINTTPPVGDLSPVEKAKIKHMRAKLKIIEDIAENECDIAVANETVKQLNDFKSWLNTQLHN